MSTDHSTWRRLSLALLTGISVLMTSASFAQARQSIEGDWQPLPPVESTPFPLGTGVADSKAGAPAAGIRNSVGEVLDGSCYSVGSRLHQFADQGVQEIICLSEEPKSRPILSTHALQRRVRSGPVSADLPTAPGRLPAAGPYPHPADEWALSGVVDEWYYGRMWTCLVDLSVSVDTLEVPSGRVVGNAVYTITHAVGLDPKNATWSNYSAYYLESRRDRAATLVRNRTTCRSCNGNLRVGDAIGGEKSAPFNTAMSGSVDLSDDPGTDQIRSGIGVTWVDELRLPGSSVIPMAGPCGD